MTEDSFNPSDTSSEENTGTSIVDERPVIREENIYLSRGCSCKPSLDDKTRGQQMCCCAKLSTFDWGKDRVVEDIPGQLSLVEIRFKNSRKDFFKVPEDIQVAVGDILVVEAQSGHDVGVVTLSGPLTRLQYQKRQNAAPVEELRKVLRKALPHDVDKWNQTLQMETSTQEKARRLANSLGLKMKINDVEYQGDGSKATFYYTADDRVDFRQLIKVYAEEFRVRIEMRQIGARQEAMHLGGIGSCGRELCCVTFLSNFHSVSTQTARVQQLSLNPQKLAGQCGKLKCCLNFEYEMYQEAVQEFPNPDIPLFTKKGKALWQKTDVFSKAMFYAYANESSNLIGLPVEAVHEIIRRNQQKDYPETIEQFALQGKVVPNEEVEMFDNVVGQDDLTRFDRQGKSRSKVRPQGGGRERPEGSRERPQGDRERPEGRRERPQGDRERPQGSRERPQGNRERPEGSRERPQGNRERPEGRRERPQGNRERPEGNRERPEGSRERPQGDRERPQGNRERPELSSSEDRPIGRPRPVAKVAQEGHDEAAFSDNSSPRQPKAVGRPVPRPIQKPILKPKNDANDA